MNFDKRFNNSMANLSNWTKSPPNVDLPNVDSDARNALVALQAQIQTLNAVNKVVTDMLCRTMSSEVKTEFLKTLDSAQKIRKPSLSIFEDIDFDDEDKPVVRKSGRKKRKPKTEQPASLTEWFNKLGDVFGVSLRHHQVLYRHARFEQPRVIFLLNTDAEHQKIINWTHSKILDYAVQYGTEEGTEQHWLYFPTAALVEHGMTLPEGAEGHLHAG